MRVEAYGRSDPGERAPDNQDELRIHWPTPAADARELVGVFAVADGAGAGDNGVGSVASQLFVEEVSRRINQIEGFSRYCFERDRELREALLAELARALQETSATIYEKAQGDPELRGICATGLVMVVAAEGVFVAHAGNCRAYLVRSGQIHRMTEDHTVANQWVRDGAVDAATAASSPFAHVLTRSFGMLPHVEVDTVYVKAEPGDRFILCSDGLHVELGSDEILHASQEQRGPKALAEALIAEAKRRGGSDDTTVAVIDITRSEEHAGADLPLSQQLEWLRGVYLFDGFNDQELMRVMRIAYVQRRQAGEVIIAEGGPGEDFFLVLDGELEVTTGGAHLNHLEPGSHFGEIALLDDCERSATVTATTDVVLMTMTREEFSRLISSEHRIASRLLLSFARNLGERVRDLTREVRELSGG